jgi:hypothetical protein
MQAYKTSQGNWQLNFCEGGIQKTLYLGRRFTAVSADRVARIITEILAHRNRGDSLSVDLRRKIESLPVRIRRGIERFGLVSDLGDHTLSDLLLSFYDSKKHFKKGTLLKYESYGNLLVKYFGGDHRLSGIQSVDCERFRSHCLERFSVCTVSRGIRGCRSIFRHAVDLEWLLKNPFAKVRGGVEVNLERQHYIERQVVRRVMDFCENDSDRLILALARFGGFRIPSEIQDLRFGDFAGNVIKIHKDTKTGAREVPLFSEIKSAFDRLTANKKVDPAAFVFVSGLSGYRCRILMAIRRSGFEVWEKLFVNLRSSCITDLAERGYSEKTLDAIFGNSSQIRSLHYIQFRKEREYLRVLQDDDSLFKSESSPTSASPASVPSTVPPTSASPASVPSTIPPMSASLASVPSTIPPMSASPASVPSTIPPMSASPASVPSTIPPTSASPASVPSTIPIDVENNELLLRLIGSPGYDLDEILVLRDLLVSHFGTVKKAS